MFGVSFLPCCQRFRALRSGGFRSTKTVNTSSRKLSGLMGGRTCSRQAGVQLTTSPAIEPNPCYALAFCLWCRQVLVLLSCRFVCLRIFYFTYGILFFNGVRESQAL